MTKLKPEHVEILILRYEQGYSDDEIARMLGQSRIKVAVTLYRARAQLKKIIGESPGMFPQGGRSRGGYGAQLSTEGELR